LNEADHDDAPSAAARPMTGLPPRERLSARQTLAFYARLAAMLVGLAAFGLAVFYLRRSL
jgi:hypothetical protein